MNSYYDDDEPIIGLRHAVNPLDFEDPETPIIQDMIDAGDIDGAIQKIINVSVFNNLAAYQLYLRVRDAIRGSYGYEDKMTWVISLARNALFQWREERGG